MKWYNLGVDRQGNLYEITSNEGQWVRYTDAAAIAAECDRLRGQRDMLLCGLKSARDILRKADYDTSVFDAFIEDVEHCQDGPHD